MLQVQIGKMRVILRFGFCMMLLGMLYLLGDRILICLCCAALHECGHLAACRLLGIPVEELEFRFTGLELRLKGNDTLLLPEKVILLHGSGIFCNLLCAAGFYLCGLHEWAATSLVLALFHAIPMRGMDGSRVFEAIGVLLFGIHSEWWEYLGQGIGFLIFSLLAAAALSKGQTMLAMMLGLFALCGILPQKKKR